MNRNSFSCATAALCVGIAIGAGFARAPAWAQNNAAPTSEAAAARPAIAPGSGVTPPAMPPGECTKPVLMLVQGRITAFGGMGEYARKLRDTGIYPSVGGYYVASGRPVDIFEGAYPDDQTFIVARFPCLAKARAFWYSELYQREILPLRAGAGTFSVSVYEEQPRP
jgi:uncharacterized protein (DUF1330 family)